MFSFGGFSSILPYIGYLSVMWVCILIGASGQVNKLLGIITTPAHTVESTVTEERISSTTILFEKIVINIPRQTEELFAAFLFLPYKILNPDKIPCFGANDNYQLEYAIASCGLRAPPDKIS